MKEWIALAALTAIATALASYLAVRSLIERICG